jgi:hypothetical protein
MNPNLKHRILVITLTILTQEAFSIELGSWVDEWSFPPHEKINIEALSWESLIGCIEVNDLLAYQSVKMFYNRCLIHNGPRQRIVSS